MFVHSVPVCDATEKRLMTSGEHTYSTTTRCGHWLVKCLRCCGVSVSPVIGIPSAAEIIAG